MSLLAVDGMSIMSLTSPNRGWALEEIEYDSGRLESIYDGLMRLCDAGDNARVVLRNIDGGLEGRGQSITLVQRASGGLAEQMQPTIIVLRSTAAVVRAYGESVATHARTANGLIDDVEAAHAAFESAQTTLEDAEFRAQVCTPGDSVSTRAQAQQDAADARSEFAAARAALEELWERWESAYSLWDEAYGNAVVGLARSDGAALGSAALSALDALGHADSPSEVAEIWSGLSAEQRATLHETYPEFVGNLEGVPYADRFEANRAVYERVIASGPYGEPLDTQFANLGRELTRGQGQLLMFHPFEQPQATAAVIYGVSAVDANGNAIDPFEGITNVNVLVGGMFSGLDDLEDWGESARNLNYVVGEYGNGSQSATIAWYGYDSPDLVTEFEMGSATEGAATLSGTLRGLDHETSSAVTTSVVGHSYGSTTAFLAVGGSSDNLGVDNLIAVGSAGVPDERHEAWTGDDAMDYSGTHIFATRAPGDSVAFIGRITSSGHGINPEMIPGAVSFESDGGAVPAFGGGSEYAVGTPGHASHDGGNSVWGWWEDDNGYLTRDSESFRNVGYIVANGVPIS